MPMTTTDPKLIERIARALCLALGRRGDTEAVERNRVEADWPRYVQHAHYAYPVIAAAINEAVQKERAGNYKSFTDGMEAAAQICGSLAETTYDDADAFEAATGCEAAIMRVVMDQRREQAAIEAHKESQP